MIISEEERPEPMQEDSPQLSEREGNPQLSGREGRPRLSEEEHAKFRGEMRELMDRSYEMTREEWKKAQAELYERYGFGPR